jgi:hypothetical protein
MSTTVYPKPTGTGDSLGRLLTALQIGGMRITNSFIDGIPGAVYASTFAWWRGKTGFTLGQWELSIDNKGTTATVFLDVPNAPPVHDDGNVKIIIQATVKSVSTNVPGFGIAAGDQMVFITDPKDTNPFMGTLVVRVMNKNSFLTADCIGINTIRYPWK